MIMEAFFRKHIEGFLVGFALVMVAAIVVCFIWGMVYISENLDNVFGSKAVVAPAVSFDLPGARSLNLRGFIQQ